MNDYSYVNCAGYFIICLYLINTRDINLENDKNVCLPAVK
jgi:hypothetical protein